MRDHPRTARLFTILGIALIACAGCNQSKVPTAPKAAYQPDIQPANFVIGVDNEFFPLNRGTVMRYEGVTEDGDFAIESHVLHEPRMVMGIPCTVVEVTEWVEGEVSEVTHDWYAQDRDGTVWYFGEETFEIDDGVIVSTEGSWEAGVDGAQPGIVMLGDPVPGESYRQEYSPGVAEDTATVIAVGVTMTVPYGTFKNCVETQDESAADPGEVEQKHYAPGVGLIQERDVSGTGELAALVDIFNEEYAPVIVPTDFVAVIDNPYLPTTPGTLLRYRGMSEGEVLEIDKHVTHETETIMGVTCTVVRVTERIGGEVVEITKDWLAQDLQGNVWYFGEDTAEYEDGEIVSTDGSWQAGQDGVYPGIVMLADPQPGTSYRQEYSPGVAEDMAIVLATGVVVAGPMGVFSDCVTVQDESAADPGEVEQKYYAPGVGLVWEVEVNGLEWLELVGISDAP